MLKNNLNLHQMMKSGRILRLLVSFLGHLKKPQKHSPRIEHLHLICFCIMFYVFIKLLEIGNGKSTMC
jgi:hypothetical protein